MTKAARFDADIARALKRVESNWRAEPCLPADGPHRNLGRRVLGAPLPNGAVRFELPSALDRVDDGPSVPRSCDVFGADADIGRQARPENAVRRDAKPVASVAERLA